MVFEIERRSLLDESEFARVKLYLDQKGSFLGERRFVSYLFDKPRFLRVRIEGQKVTVTEREGDYEDVGRAEITTEIRYKDLVGFIKDLSREGFKKYSQAETRRFSYEFNKVAVELNEITGLGLIVEVEALTENKEDKSSLDARVKSTLKMLGLKELPHETYKQMMRKIYEDSHDISELRFN